MQPFVDTHLHLWDPGHFRMSWLAGLAALDRPFRLADYQAQARDLPVEGLVYLQVEVDPAYGFLEARWALDRADEDPRIQAIVAYAPLQDGDPAQSYLEALVRLDPRIKGVRRIIQFEPDPNFCLQPRFVRGVQLLADHGLSFDICIDHRQLANTLKLVERCPRVHFMLDHIAKPNIREHVLDPWRAALARLAEFPNVFCKISGMLTEADPATWQPADLAPYLDHVIATFGEDRIVFGGDWPVLLQVAPYRRWVETVAELTAGLGPVAQRKFWSENARRFYRLPAPDPA